MEVSSEAILLVLVARPREKTNKQKNPKKQKNITESQPSSTADDSLSIFIEISNVDEAKKKKNNK